MNILDYVQYEAIILSIVNQFGPPKILSTPNNIKLGAILNFSTLTYHGCPGKTEWCAGKEWGGEDEQRGRCYDLRSRKITATSDMRSLVKGAYHMHWAVHDPVKLFKILTGDIYVNASHVVRMPVGGDYFSEQHIRVWIEVVKQFPEIVFYGYTRSWRIPELYEVLKELRDLDNMALFASVDMFTGVPPFGKGAMDKNAFGTVTDKDIDGWRLAQIAGQEFLKGVLLCPEETGHVTNCMRCGYCFNKKINRNSKGVLRHVTFIDRLQATALKRNAKNTSGLITRQDLARIYT